MDTLGKHLLAEYHGCEANLLNDVHAVETMMTAAAEAAGTRVVKTVFHRFEPQGVSGVVVIEESHLSIHTWPEKGYAAVDCYTCGDGMPEKAFQYLKEVLKPLRSDRILVQRGLEVALDDATQTSMHLGDVSIETTPAMTFSEHPVDEDEEEQTVVAARSSVRSP